MATKILLLTWPLLWIAIGFRSHTFAEETQRTQSLIWGALSGTVIIGLGALLFITTGEYFSQFVPEFLIKINDFNLTTPGKYILFSIAFSTFHALIEEYYWRWFVFGGLLNYLSPKTAAVISSIGFGAHHLIVLGQYFPLWITVILGFTVIGGGLFWCYLYTKTRTIIGGWVSHICVDLVIMALGYAFIF